MISRIKGTLVKRDLDRIEVETPGGVVYEVQVPLTILQRLPAPPAEGFEIRTLQVVREDSVTLYGFVEEYERDLFSRLLAAKGVGPKVALARLSTYTAPRLAQALAEKDIPALTQVSGVGKKTAERIALELADRVQDLALAGGGTAVGEVGDSQEAVAALVALGYSFANADAAIRRVLEQGEPQGREDLIRKALSGE